MRLPLLLLLAYVTAIAAPFAAFAARPDLLPGDASVLQGWEDAAEVARLAWRGWWNAPVTPPQPDAPMPFDGSRLVMALAVLAIAAVWFVGFLTGGGLGLALLGVRLLTLALASALLVLSLYSCRAVTLSFSLDIAPDQEPIARALLLLGALATASGFLVASGFRRLTV